jgi:hypothetical protein
VASRSLTGHMACSSRKPTSSIIGLSRKSLAEMWRHEMSELLLAVLTEALGAALLALLMAAARRVAVRRPA